MKPAIVTIDDDPFWTGHISGELERRYARDYRIVFEVSPDAALSELERMARSGEPVALVLSDLWMRGVSGIEVLDRVKVLHPQARRAMLIAWGDWADENTADAIREAIAQGVCDRYVLKPWKSPDELFHQTVTSYLHAWSRDDASTPHELTVISPQRSPKGHALRDLLTHNRVPHSSLTSESPEGASLLERAGQSKADVPVVVLNDGRILVDPSEREVAEAYGAMTQLPTDTFDVAIIGAGPGGLAASVYASSEGLRTLVVERRAIGGQAGSSSMIRNYLGFAGGIEGSDLTQRAYQQAWTFGARFLLTHEVVNLTASADGTHTIELEDGAEITAGAVVLAMGVRYKMLDVPALDALQGSGVFYGASPSEARQLAGGRVYVVGAGNSAGQAAIHLARYASSVTIVVRGDSLANSMSSYLIGEIDATPTISVLLQTQVVDGSGDTWLERLSLRGADGATKVVQADGLFVLIGAEPHTAWLPPEFARDERGFVLTGGDLSNTIWTLDREPFAFETSRPGVFAVGDVRSRSVKRVASAVGEGSVVIHHVHTYLSERAR